MTVHFLIQLAIQLIAVLVGVGILSACILNLDKGPSE